MLKICAKFITVSLTLFFLSACDNNPFGKKNEVVSGIAQETTIFTKTCGAGSLKITQENTAGVIVPTAINPQDLAVGTEVKLSGTINNGGVCGFYGAVSFSCRATVRIGLNKAFSCIGEQFISGTSSSLSIVSPSPVVSPVNPINPAPPVNPVTQAPYPTPYGAQYNQRTLITGDLIIYYGATKTFTTLTVNSSSPLVPTTCKLSFICE